MRTELESMKRAIVEHDEGPMLVIAGPGAGKTTAIVERVVHLLKEGKAAPGQIFVSTFTEKAAKELLSRVTRRLLEEKVRVAPTEMYLGTLHSLFLRILKENAEYTRLKKNAKTLDDFEQKYTVYRHFYKFKDIPDINLVATGLSAWRNAEKLCGLFNKVREETLAVEDLEASGDAAVRALGAAWRLYEEILAGDNAIDFSAIQTETLRLLESTPAVLEKLRGQLKYLVIDEYQDTNTIQEKILLLLAGEAANICVVGDEDQSIYRFRGATVQNILQFAENFPPGTCKTVVLDTNYRSHPDIVKFYNDWMTGCDWTEGKKRFRYDKTISAQPGKTFDDCAGVVRVTGETEAKWNREVLAFIRSLRKAKAVTDLNQIAFLFNSVKNEEVKRLAEYLEAHGVPVFSPRSGRFFEREPVRLMIGLLFFLFPQAREIADEMQGRLGTLQEESGLYYGECMDLLADTLRADPEKHKGLLDWARPLVARHKFLSKPTDYTFLSLFYEALQFPMFSEALAVDHDGTPQKSAAAHNLSLFSQLLERFEHIYSINILTPDRLETHLRHLFGQYLHFLIGGGLEEFEDYEDPIPSGCVSVMTIHQSKGLEFPVTVVGSLDRVPRESRGKLERFLETHHFKRKPYEPQDRTKVFDFWRAYYVAFSRAQNVLVLTGPKPRGDHVLGKETDAFALKVPDWRDAAFRPENLHLAKVKPSAVQNDYSFTGDILLYENCPLQYMAYRYLGFAPHRQAGTMFGTLVHQTIEDVHKAHLRGESFDEEQIGRWFDLNYVSLSMALKTHLDPRRKAAALDHVTRYVNRESKKFDQIVAAEVDVSVPTDAFILHGVIDLLRGEGDTVEIVDFKTERKPDVNNPDDMARVENHRRQLEVYSHIVGEKTGRRVSKMHLYYTRAVGENPYVTWTHDPERVEGTLRQIGETVAKIERHDFSNACVKKGRSQCEDCDMRHYCGQNT